MEIIGLLLKFKAKKELPVYILGQPESDEFFDASTTQDKITRVVKRSLKYHPDIEEILVHIKERRRAGRTLYRLTARAYSPTNRLYVSSKGWYLTEAFD